MPIINVFDNISGYRRYKIIVFRRTPAREVIAGQIALGLVSHLGCVVERSGSYISHTLSFISKHNMITPNCSVCNAYQTESLVPTVDTNMRIVTPLIDRDRER